MGAAANRPSGARTGSGVQQRKEPAIAVVDPPTNGAADPVVPPARPAQAADPGTGSARSVTPPEPPAAASRLMTGRDQPGHDAQRAEAATTEQPPAAPASAEVEADPEPEAESAPIGVLDAEAELGRSTGPAAKEGSSWSREPRDPWRSPRPPGGRAAPGDRPVGPSGGPPLAPAVSPAASAAPAGDLDATTVDGGGRAAAAAAVPLQGRGARPAGATQVLERPVAWQPPAGVPARVTAGRAKRLLGMPRPLLAAALALVLVLGLFGVDTALASGAVRRGVSVGGIDLGGLSRAAARAKLATAAAQVEARPLVLRAETARLTLPRSQAGVRLDVDGSLADALVVGHSGPFDLNRLRSWFGGVELPWRARLESQGVEQAVSRLDTRIRRPIREPALRLAGARVELVQGTPGHGVDTAGALRALEGAAGLPAGAEVALPVSEQRPTVDQAAAEAAAEQARKLLSGPLTVTAAGHSASLQPAELAPRVRSRVHSGRLLVELVPQALDGLLRQRAPFAYTTPRDARFQPAGKRIRLLPAVAGRVVDPVKAVAALLAAGGKEGAARTAALPVTTTNPKLTTEKAKALGVKEVVSSFTTTFSSSDAPRVHNISLIAAAVNDQLVMPGQVFSMNAATGERTPDKGYRTAKVIKDGEIVPGLGGGVCQAGTTMFNAAFFAGLPVVERRNHSLHISHYPMGRDATLNWPGTDLKFRNDSPYGIYVTARATSATMNVTLWSTSRGYDVAFSTSAPYNFRAPPTKFEDDPTLPVGQQVVESNGSSGFDVTVHRTVTHNGQVVRKDSFVSNYVPWSKVVRRGTKPPGPLPGPLPGTGA